MEKEPGFHIVTATLTIQVEVRIPDEVEADDLVENLAYDIYDEDGSVITKSKLLTTSIISDEKERG